ncbi:beta-Ala-His dipeptidase [Halobacteriovorax sp. RT-2-6]|uniref:beta-Ala-His dipeptidase n=1 Tax=unclassified Halobacteriovorax TaxID=2639665 RepID=UPI00399A5D71
MNQSRVDQLSPKYVWSNFQKLLDTPRPSYHEEAVQTLLLLFGKSLGLETYRDEVNNVIIKKPGQLGGENSAPIILQGHLDMVAQKNEGNLHDFKIDPITTIIDGDWVRANGTTLGADNGIGCAFAMGLLESKDIAHPPLECVFTACEEAGMHGAIGLKGDHFEGKIMLNLDTEEEDELIIGCAGGVDLIFEKEFNQIAAKGVRQRIAIKGLKGGHSGIDIHRGRLNANKLIPNVFAGVDDIQLVSIKGGSLRNAIAREAFVDFYTSEVNLPKIRENFESLWEKNQHAEGGLKFELATLNEEANALSIEDSKLVLSAISNCQHGVKAWDQHFEGVVETSTNLGVITLEAGKFNMANLIRSASEEARDNFAQEMISAQKDLDGKAILEGAYPGWKPNPESKILSITGEVFKDLRGKAPKISSIHAGLECGILSKAMPDVDIISFGPTITGAHSPDEQVSIASVEKTWLLFLEVVKRLM